MSEHNNELEISKTGNRKRTSESTLWLLQIRKQQKLQDCDRKIIDILQEYLTASDPILDSMKTNSNELLQLESKAMASTISSNKSITELKAHLEQRYSRLNEKFAKQNFELMRLKNVMLSKEGEDAVSVPFLDGTRPEEHFLPKIRTVADIDWLSRKECGRFLAGYGISFSDSEGANLKRKLRDAIGFSLGTDVKYSFRNFSSE